MKVATLTVSLGKLRLSDNWAWQVLPIEDLVKPDIWSYNNSMECCLERSVLVNSDKGNGRYVLFSLNPCFIALVNVS